MKIDGREIADKIFEELKEKTRKLRAKNIIPHLAIILIGNDSASIAYVNQKKIKGEIIGAKISIKRLSSDISEPQLLRTIKQLNNDSNIHGIIVQQPLPPRIGIAKITQAIDPKKDVDGFHKNSKFEMPIAMAVLRILEEIYTLEKKAGDASGGVQRRASSFAAAARLEGASLDERAAGPAAEWLKPKKIVIIGKGETGGKPIIEMFRKLNIKALVIDSKTKHPEKITKTADVIISAVGREKVIKPEMIKKGTILISIGLHKGTDGKLHGDYEEENIKNIASFYTPTPGGVGPVNVSMLLNNLVVAVEGSLH